jgi:hypothetical protein
LNLYRAIGLALSVVPEKISLSLRTENVITILKSGYNQKGRIVTALYLTELSLSFGQGTLCLSLVFPGRQIFNYDLSF